MINACIDTEFFNNRCINAARTSSKIATFICRRELNMERGKEIDAKTDRVLIPITNNQ
jgi:hypothetical protein